MPYTAWQPSIRHGERVIGNGREAVCYLTLKEGAPPIPAWLVDEHPEKSRDYILKKCWFVNGVGYKDTEECFVFRPESGGEFFLPQATLEYFEARFVLVDRP